MTEPTQETLRANRITQASEPSHILRQAQSNLPKTLPQHHLSATDAIQRRRVYAPRIFQKAIPFTALLRPSEVKRHSVAGGGAVVVRTLLSEVVEARARFHAVLEPVDEDAEDVVVVERGVARQVEFGFGA